VHIADNMQYMAQQQLQIHISIDGCCFAEHCKISEFKISRPKDFWNIKKHFYILQFWKSPCLASQYKVSTVSASIWTEAVFFTVTFQYLFHNHIKTCSNNIYSSVFSKIMTKFTYSFLSLKRFSLLPRKT